ncbi:hypothetical protein B0675_39680 [Streptomyces sp. M41(2017)]|uniref:endonuclease domain-containing protein n=1 Tax=Streptomyces sp. M41(2017) TaxID=1955065 RepID=UPI0009F10982|nr:endonuclease domain-containing protein [Streptomyces sp. M41(2017)]OQQ12947.1 hypothetical protein B0675_39680 [Streptomyces sp. M41(2017)]
MTYKFPFDVDTVAYSSPPPCGRLTKRGTACQQSPLAYWRLPKREGRPRSCLRHLTSEERAEYDREVAAAEAAEQEVRRRIEGMAPACWSWDLPNEVALRDSDPDVHGLAVIEEWQASRCAICSATTTLVTDHDHATGLVRGLLCQRCNTAEAFRDAGPYRRYRERPPAAILTVQARYWNPLAKASEDIGL